MFLTNHVTRLTLLVRFLTHHGVPALRTEDFQVLDRVRIVGEHFKRLTDLHILESLFGFEHRLRSLHPAAVQRCSHDNQASFAAIQARALSSAAGSALTSEAPAMAMSGLPPPLPPH